LSVTAGFQDLFSRHAGTYSQFRPTYPKALYDYLASLTCARDQAWDAGTGNGQCAVALADYFTQVHASDPSAEQIAHAKPHPRVTYAVGMAEASGLPAVSVDLITAAQAAHWFDMDGFTAEARRVLKPGGVVALWSYGFHHSGDAVLDELLDRFGLEILGPYWAEGARHTWERYARLPFAFREIAAPTFHLDMHLTLAELTGYLESWSAPQKFRAVHGRSPLADIHKELEAAWGNPQQKRLLRCPLGLRLGLAD
jgi:ubiquinone/menaquinone biosynthesis C-methylase UbiE